MPRPTYPSDHRRWFRVMEDILDDPKLNGEEWVWGAYFRTLAMLNRVKSRDGILRVSDRQLGVLMGRSRGDVARKRLASAVHLRLFSAARYADYTLILVSKWPEHQGFTPAELRRDSVQTPAPTPTPKTTPKKKQKEAAPAGAPRAPRSGVSMCPDPLPDDDARSLADWCAANGHTPEAMAHAIEVVRDWAASNGKRKRDWVATIRNAMRDGWALKGYDPPGGNGAAKRPKSWAEIQAEETKQWLIEVSNEQPGPDRSGTLAAVSRLPERRHR